MQLFYFTPIILPTKLPLNKLITDKFYEYFSLYANDKVLISFLPLYSVRKRRELMPISCCVRHVLVHMRERMNFILNSGGDDGVCILSFDL